jgi:hypothetical protein
MVKRMEDAAELFSQLEAVLEVFEVEFSLLPGEGCYVEWGCDGVQGIKIVPSLEDAIELVYREYREAVKRGKK